MKHRVSSQVRLARRQTLGGGALAASSEIPSGEVSLFEAR